MDLDLSGMRALVTGSSSGIGEETARMLSQEGARVVVHGRDRARAEKVAQEIGAAGVAIGELQDERLVDAVHAQAEAVLGGSVQILINNAGGNAEGNSAKPPAEIATDHFLSNYRANMLGAVRFCQLCVPAMVSARFGRIVNVSSAVAVQPNNVGADYSAAKAALNNYTVSLAGSLRGVNVTANVLSPGIIVVDGLLRFGRQRFGDPAMTFEEVSARFAAEKVFDVPPVGRFGFTRDLAMVACLLASPRSGFITGANYRVDGGQVRSLN